MMGFEAERVLIIISCGFKHIEKRKDCLRVAHREPCFSIRIVGGKNFILVFTTLKIKCGREV
jgi:hypothetical protein